MGSDFYFPHFPPKPNNKLRLIMFVCLVMSTHFPLPPFPSKPKFLQAKPKPSFKLCSSLSTVSVPPTKTSHKPFPAEVSRTIMELSSIGTLSTLAQDGWPLGVGVRFAVDAEGTPVCACLNLLLMQCGLRTPQCTIQGSLTKPADVTILRHKPKSCEFQTHKGDRIKVHYRLLLFLMA